MTFNATRPVLTRLDTALEQWERDLDVTELSLVLDTLCEQQVSGASETSSTVHQAVAELRTSITRLRDLRDMRDDGHKALRHAVSRDAYQLHSELTCSLAGGPDHCIQRQRS